MFTAIARMDKTAFHHVVTQAENHGLESVARKISATGDGPVYLYLSVLCLLLHSQGERLFDSLLAGYLIELPLYLVLKNTIRRPRPCHGACDVALKLEPSDKFSLPSGHTAAAFVMVTSVWFVFPALIYLALAWAISIGLSRIALGVHYPLDIIAGAMLGSGSVFFIQQFV